MWLRFYVEYKIGVCIIGSIPHCHTEMLSKGAKSRNEASFLYSRKVEYISSIVFHTVIQKMLSKQAKSTNLCRKDNVAVSIIDSIHTENVLKRGKNQEM